jgi:SAM-dependent methyltransferase
VTRRDDTLDAVGDLTELAVAATPTELGALGARLRYAGLNARALAAWAGTARVSALPPRLDAMAGTPPTPAGAVLALFVAGVDVARDRLHSALGAMLEPLIAWELIEPRGDRLRARVAIVPVGSGLLVCDRLDTAIERDLVCWPDDSSHHLATAIPPGRRAGWLDLGCGSAFAPLARPELAHRIAGVDINPRAVRHAQLGAALSGLAQFSASVGHVGDPAPPADLVTCNAPMPFPGEVVETSAVAEGARPSDVDRELAHLLQTALPEVWRHADRGFFAQLWPALRRAVRPGGLIVVHAASEAILPALADAPGERVVVTYTPDGVPGFAVAWWQPDASPRFVATRRALSPERPHVDPRDRDDALAGHPA